VSPAEFKRSLTHQFPRAGLPPPLTALWWAAKGDWDKAHGLVMGDESREAAWVHAHLHRVEGNLDNAGYWYGQAGRAMKPGAPEVEWDEIVAALAD
jgi:hypothetical protein